MNLKHFSKYWLPVILYIVLIFIISSRAVWPIPLGRVTNFSYEYEVKHVIEFAVLGILMFRAFNHSENIKIKKTALLLAFAFTTFYGITDELHQLFVPGKICSGIDMFADSVGACFITFKNLFKK